MKILPSPALAWLLLRFGLMYFMLAVAGIYLSRQPGNVATLWFPNALGVAYLLSEPPRRWPAVLLCGALALALANALFANPMVLVLMLVLANLLEMCCAAFLVRRTCADQDFTDSPERYLRFIGLACCLPGVIGATIGAASLALWCGARFAVVWPAWFCGSAIGAVGLLPLALLVRRQGRAFWHTHVEPARSAGYIVLSLTLSVVALFYFPYPFVYVMLPLMAAAVRLSFESAALTMWLSSLATGTIISAGLVPLPPLTNAWQFLTVYLPILLTMVPPMMLAASMNQARVREQGRREFELALKRNHQELQTITDHLPAVIAYWDTDLHNRFGNRAFLDTYGMSAQQMRGKHVREVVGEAHFADNLPRIEAALRGETVMFERSHLDAGGGRRDVVGSYLPDLVGGKVQGFYALITDITPLKQAQRQQQEAQAQLQGIIDSASDFMITATSIDGLIEVFSRGAERALGYRASEVVGKQTPLLFHDPHEVAARRAALSAKLGRQLSEFDLFAELALNGHSDTRPWTYVRQDGTRLPVSLMVTAIRDEARQVIGFLGIAHDISSQLQMEHSLVRAKEAAESASRAKSEFVANMSHEIRTPLNAVLGMAHLLAGTGLTADQQRYLEMIRSSGQSLLGILNDILDFSKIEAGRMELAPAPFALGDVLGALANIMTVNAGEKDLELAIGMAPGVPQRLVGDEMRLQQILVNLTGNAIKFTAHGEVSVLVETVPASGLEAAPGSTVTLAFTVRDTGIGMDAAQQEGVFNAFSQADTSMTRRFGGTGLGLTISKRLVELMGGAISVRSAPGQGSEFRVSLPLMVDDQVAGQVTNQVDDQVDDQVENRATTDAPARVLHLLVVDDNHTSRDYLCQTIAAWRWRCDSAASGAEAVARVQALQQRGERYDAMLVDWQMPGMDGLSTMRALRALQASRTAPVLIMAGAFGRGKLMQEEGCDQADAILVKPVTGSVLFDALQGVLGRSDAARGSPFAPRAAPAHPALVGARLLLVEDNPLNQIVARGVLEKAGALVEVASDGRQALALLEGAPQRFDLILMDVQMPVMDGFAATRAIRTELGLTLPVLAMTAGVMATEREQCMASGMDDFIAKPLDMEQMFATITRYLA